MKARKAMALAMTAAMVGGLMTVPVMAEENAELLPGGGSKIIYCITPSTSNPFFNTEQVIAKEKAEELGYEVKCASHDDDAAIQKILSPPEAPPHVRYKRGARSLRSSQ